MNNKGKSNKKSYIILFVILLVAFIGIFVLLEIAKNERKSKPLKENSTTPTINIVTTTNVIEPDKNEEIGVKNFNASLEEIINGKTFYYDYEVSIKYSGALFDFNCTKYNEANSICVSGSGLMNTGNALIPLYTYENSEENYLLHQEDYYIIVNDNYIILTTNYVNKSSGNIRVYDKEGRFISKYNNVITGYKLNNKIVKRLYPNISDNLIYYYICDKNEVKIVSSNIEKNGNINYQEKIVNASCY